MANCSIGLNHNGTLRLTAENGAESVRQCPCGASVVEGRGHLQKVLGKLLLGLCLPLLAWEHVGDNTLV